MNCPACKHPLRERGAGDMTLDVCHGGCGGIWFDAAELERVNSRAAATLHTIWQIPKRDAQPEAPRLCPRCPQQQLDRKWFSDSKRVEIDQCPKCGGIWLDDGEFTKVFAELKQKGKVGSPPWALAMAEAVHFVQANPDPRPPRA